MKSNLNMIFKLGYLYGSFGDSNDRNMKVIFHGDLWGSTDNKVLISDEGIKLGLFDG